MWTSFQSWWNQPFRSSGSVWNWALFVLLIIVLICMWARVIRFVELAGEAVV